MMKIYAITGKNYDDNLDFTPIMLGVEKNNARKYKIERDKKEQRTREKNRRELMQFLACVALFILIYIICGVIEIC